MNDLVEWTRVSISASSRPVGFRGMLHRGRALVHGSVERSRDVAHDAELRLRGYTVLRFTYVQIVHDWPAVARAISRAVAAGAHLA